MEESEESIVEEREELMVSPTGGNPFLKKAFFLKPTSPSAIDEPPFDISRCLSSVPARFEPEKWALRVEFRGWATGLQVWKTWVDQMAPVHQSTWKKSGIYEAIISSTYQIKKQKELVYGFAERWCSETNTFIFPWGEATITLEDVMVLGGFSVLGNSVSSPLKSKDLKVIEQKLLEGRREIYRSGATDVDTSLWQKKFMNSGNEIEHEAFLVFWLSRYVFVRDRTGGGYAIHKDVFSVAIHLARGTRIALAPGVLASIYRDLGLLKKAIVDSNQSKTEQTLRISPFHLVQVWAWERFSDISPVKPKSIHSAEPRMARWDKVNGPNVQNLRMVLDSAGESFLWRPYALDVIENWHLPKYYPKQEMWVLVGPDSDVDLLSFVRCLRVSELGGLSATEHYLPYRVAMQFGYDQDLPFSVTHPSAPWKHGNKEISNVKLYVPSRLAEVDISTKYLNWWKQLVPDAEDSCAAAVPRRKRTKSLQWLLSRPDQPPVPPGFPPELKRKESEDPMYEQKDILPVSDSELSKHIQEDNIRSRQDRDSEKLSGRQLPNLVSPPGDEETSVTTLTSDEQIVRIIGNESASSSSLVVKRLLELKARCKKFRSVIEAQTLGYDY